MARKRLALSYSDKRHDNFTYASEQAAKDAEAAGYRLVRFEGVIWTEGPIEDRTVPLQLWYSDERKDNFTLASEQAKNDAIAAGYRFVRYEGFIDPNTSF